MTSPRTIAPLSSRLPASIAAGRTHIRRRRLRRVAMAGAVLAVVGAGVVGASRVGTTSAPTYRTATAGAQPIDATLTAVATIEPVTQATAAFPVAGTVSTVEVAVGDTVTVGQRLASLDTTALDQALRQAQASLAQAELVLQTALDGDDPSMLGIQGASYAGSASIVAAAFTGTGEFQFASALVAVTDDELAAAQQAVINAQSAVSSAVSDASAALDSAISICAAVDSRVTVTTDPDDPTAPPTVDTSPITACQSALDAVVAAQQTVSSAQSALSSAADSLRSLLDERAAELDEQASNTTTTTPTTAPDTAPPTDAPPGTTPPTGSTPDGSTPTGSTPSGSTPDSSTPDSSTPDSTTPGSRTPGGSAGGGAPSGGGSIGAGGSSSSEPSAEDLISYQASVDAATAQVTVAIQELAQTIVVSPIAGTVISVGIAAGDDAEAASTTQTIVVEGPGGYEATASISLTDIPGVEVGQAAVLAADGATDTVAGQVSAISAVPDSTGATTTYRVTVSLTGDTSTLGNGAIGSLAITTGTATAAVAVPTSAVTTTDGRSTVTVYDGTMTSEVMVQVGVIGATYTEITSGLDAGATVVLADLSEPLPSAATDASDRGDTGDSGFTFPGGGNFPGGVDSPGGGRFTPPG